MKHDIIESFESHTIPSDPVKRTIREEAIHILTVHHLKYIQHLTCFNQHAIDKLMEEYDPPESLIKEEMDRVREKYFK